MADASLNRRQTICVGAGVAFAQVGILGFDGQIGLEALRLFWLPEAAPAVLYARPSVPVETREFAADVSWDLPSPAPGATALIDVTVNRARAGDLAKASLLSSTRFIEIDAAVWTNNKVRAMLVSFALFSGLTRLSTVPGGSSRRRRRMPQTQ